MMFQLRPHQQRGLDAMEKHSKGIIVMSTGAGKTNVGIFDAIRQFLSPIPQTIVVVAPRILLADQLSSEYLEFITNASVLHIHSGKTRHFSSTKSDVISSWYDIHKSSHKLIFTTYHSLHQLQRAGIKVDTILFDEAHNSVQKNFYPAVEYFSRESNRDFYFTATPKHSATPKKPGMNDTRIYGQVICNVSAPELVDGGFILPPKVVVKQLEMVTNNVFDRDCEHLIDTIDDIKMNKILICAKATKQIVSLVSQSEFCKKLEQRGYSWMYITSKTGAVIDGKKVSREVFFETLNAWGKNDDKKFVVLHHSILSEGINVSGLEAVVFMRSMDYIGISQTIGRVIRLHQSDAEGLRSGSIAPGDLECYTKSFGLVCVPVFSKAGISTARKIEAVVHTVFHEGQPAISTIKR